MKKLAVAFCAAALLCGLLSGCANGSISSSASGSSRPTQVIDFSDNTGAQDIAFLLGKWGAPIEAEHGILTDSFEFLQDGTVYYTNALYGSGAMTMYMGSYAAQGAEVAVTLTEIVSYGEDGPPDSSDSMAPLSFSLSVQPNDEESILITLPEMDDTYFFVNGQHAGSAPVIFYNQDALHREVYK